MSVGDDGVTVTGPRPVSGPIIVVPDFSLGRYETTCTNCAQRIESNDGVWWSKPTRQSTCPCDDGGHQPHVKIEPMTGRMMYELCPAAHQVRTQPGAPPDFTLCRKQIGHEGMHTDQMGAVWSDNRDSNARPETDPMPEYRDAPVKARRKSAAAGLIER